MDAVRIGPKHQITIPVAVFRKLRLDAGDFLEVETVDDAIVLVPRKLIPKNQEWFWTKRWQTMEKAAQGDLDSGRVVEGSSMKTLLKKLKK
jgi:AbrB family looped-hinge helix DNA binding protein